MGRPHVTKAKKPASESVTFLKSVRYSLLRQVRVTVFLPKAWRAIIGMQEVVRGAITRNDVLFGSESEGEP
jgi:hypothetical protein